MLSINEIRKLVRGHNILNQIRLPRNLTLAQITAKIKKAGYTVNHAQRRLDANVKRGKQITMARASAVLPARATAASKASALSRKRERVIKFIIQYPSVLQDQRVQNL